METSEITQHLKTLRDYIRWGCSEFYRHRLSFGHGFDRAIDEAVYLVLHSLSLPWDYPERYFNTILLEKEREQVLKILIQRIYTRKPAAYLTHEAWFCGLPFYVDERVLVPRSPIAELINERFEPWTHADEIKTILDCCTGSACIAISCQFNFPQAQLSASDLSPDALDVARINLQKHGLTEGITLYESDLFERIPAQKFDLIVANPPYVDSVEMAVLTDEFKAEPEMGLAAGKDGLQCVDRILLQAQDYLSEKGLLVVEVGHSQPAMMEKYDYLPLSWIEFEHGGSGVFCITAKQLKESTRVSYDEKQ